MGFFSDIYRHLVNEMTNIAIGCFGEHLIWHYTHDAVNKKSSKVFYKALYDRFNFIAWNSLNIFMSIARLRKRGIPPIDIYIDQKHAWNNIIL